MITPQCKKEKEGGGPMRESEEGKTAGKWRRHAKRERTLNADAQAGGSNGLKKTALCQGSLGKEGGKRVDR